MKFQTMDLTILAGHKTTWEIALTDDAGELLDVGDVSAMIWRMTDPDETYPITPTVESGQFTFALTETDSEALTPGAAYGWVLTVDDGSGEAIVLVGWWC